MHWYDPVQAGFQSLGVLAVWSNTRALWRDRRVAGVSPLNFAHFSIYGTWSLYFYLRLGLPLSAIASGCALLGNLAWLALWWRCRGSK